MAETHQEIKRTPILLEDNSTSLKASIQQTKRLLSNIKFDAERNQHRPALLYVKDKRDFVPKLVEVTGFTKHFICVRYKCYDPEGKFRQYINTSVLYVDLMIGERHLKFFEDDI